MRFSSIAALSIASDTARAVNMRGQHPAKSLVQTKAGADQSYEYYSYSETVPYYSSSTMYYSEPMTYYGGSSMYYSEPMSYYGGSSTYYSSGGSYYGEPTTYYSEPSVYSYEYYSEPVVIQSGGGMTSGVTSYSSGGGSEYSFAAMSMAIGAGSEYLAAGYHPIPEGMDFGVHPVWKIIVGKDVNAPPAGYYLPDMDFVLRYENELIYEAETLIGEWAVVAFNGGKFEGKPRNNVLCDGGCLTDPLYDVMHNPGINDVLVVAADPGLPPYVPPTNKPTPTCDIEGWDCECEPKSPIDPFSRKPTPGGSYEWFDRDVTAWHTWISGYGWRSDGTTDWTPLPNGYVGYWIFLDQWEIFGYEHWEEWKFGVTIRNEQTGGYVDWNIIGGVEYYDQKGDEVYEYVVEIPDQPEVQVGEWYCWVYYDATINNGIYVPATTPAYDGPCFQIGEPYRDFGDEDEESDWIWAIFQFADWDHDGCATYDDMVKLFEWGVQDADMYVEFVSGYFTFGDLNGDGLLTWAELNAWLASNDLANVGFGSVLEGEEKEAMKAFFKFFDKETGNEDYALTMDEAIAGTQHIAGKIGAFYADFNFFWQFFDAHGVGHDNCVTYPDLRDAIEDAWDVTDDDITNYWIKYYWETYQITEYYWRLYQMGNGGFDWERYWSHTPDGPAFNGVEWLVMAGFDGSVQNAYMWWLADECYFSLGYIGNNDPYSSGTCTLDGYQTISDIYEGNGHDVDTIKWYLYAMPEHAIKFEYQLGEWGPIETTTTERYFAGGDAQYWLWQRPTRYCDVCNGGEADWGVIDFDSASAYVEPVLVYEDGSEMQGGFGYDDYSYYEYSDGYYMEGGSYTTTEVVSSSYSEVYYETSEPVLVADGEEMVGGFSPPASCGNFIDSYGDDCSYYENPANTYECDYADNYINADGLTAVDCCEVCSYVLE